MIKFDFRRRTSFLLYTSQISLFTVARCQCVFRWSVVSVFPSFSRYYLSEEVLQKCLTSWNNTTYVRKEGFMELWRIQNDLTKKIPTTTVCRSELRLILSFKQRSIWLHLSTFKPHTWTGCAPFFSKTALSFFKGPVGGAPQSCLTSCFFAVSKV